MRFHHPAVPIVVAALIIDTIGFGIVLPVLPDLVVHLGQVSLPEATRIAGYLLVAFAAPNFSPGRYSAISAIASGGGRSCSSR